jgi:hypothetical protein
VLAYDTQKESNGVGAEYIIMEKYSGIELGRVWGNLLGKQKMEIVKQLATFTAQLSHAKFPYYGSLYYSKDIPNVSGTQIDSRFSVGPTTSRTWFDDKRGEVDVICGPCKPLIYAPRENHTSTNKIVKNLISPTLVGGTL